MTELLAERQLPAEGALARRLAKARQQLASSLRRYSLSDGLERQLLAALLDRLAVARPLAPAGQATSAAQRDALSPEQLSRLEEQLSQQWLAHVEKVWQRLHQDAALLRSRLGVEPERVAAVELALGDRHHGGQTVTELCFEGGTSLIYKPRSVELEAFFSPLLALVSSDALPLRGLDVLAGDGYGWVRKELAQPCTSGAQIERFHERLGALLAIAYAFGGTDLHEDNLIAVGDHPVLIDLETLISAPLPGAPEPEQLEYSVFDVGLLPSWLPDAQGQPVLSGGIGGGLLADGAFVAGPQRHVARLGDQLCSPLEHAADVQRGFSSAYRRLLAVRPELIGLCEGIRSASYRCVLRPTRHYTLALALALQGTGQRHPQLRERLSELLPPLARNDGEGRARAAELDSLEALDVPYFSGTLAEPALYARQGEGEVLQLAEPPWVALQRRLVALSESDLARQAHRVAAAFAAARAHCATAPDLHRGATAPDVQRRATAQPTHHGATARRAERRDATPLAFAGGVAAALEAALCRTADGGATWLQPSPWPGHGVWQLARTDLSLATGRTGLAVFFAALAQLTGQTHALGLASDCLRWLPSALASWREAPQSLAAGRVGALLYGLTLCGQLARNAQLLEAARELALLLPEPAAEAHSTLWSGHAATVLGLLSVAEAQPDARAARQLVARALPFARQLAPSSPFGASRIGEGAAAVCFSLWRLHGALERAGLPPAPELTQPPWLAALKAVAPTSEPPCAPAEQAAQAGCHEGLCDGPLARAVAMASCTPDAGPPQALLEEREAEQDQYCCGNAGSLDLSLELAQRWPALRPAMQRRLSALRARALARPGYRLHLGPELPRPGLLDGLAGIGYMWLRQHDPRLPCLLLWHTLRA